MDKKIIRNAGSFFFKITCRERVKGAVCRILTLLKHKNTIICLQTFRKHVKLTYLFIWKTMLQSVILLWKCAFRPGMSVFVMVCETRPLPVSGPSLADAGPCARYGVGPPSVRLRSRYGGGGVGFRSSRGAGPGATAPVAPPKGRPWPVYPIVFRHPGLPVGGKHSIFNLIHHHVRSFLLVLLIWHPARAQVWGGGAGEKKPSPIFWIWTAIPSSILHTAPLTIFVYFVNKVIEQQKITEHI